MSVADQRGELTVEQRSATAEELADAARAVYGIRAPIDPSYWCRQVGVALEWRAQFEEGRYLRPVNQPPSIVIQEGQRGLRRSHFTLAHELGHHLIEETRRNVELRNYLTDRALRTLSRITTASSEEERLCDEIAGALLLPIETVRAIRQPDGRPCLADLLDMASRHRTSHAATMRRYRRIIGAEMTYALCERVRRVDTDQDEWFVIDQQDLGLQLPTKAWLRPLWTTDDERRGNEEGGHRGYSMWFVPTSRQCRFVWTDWQRLRGGRYAVLVMEAPAEACHTASAGVCRSRVMSLMETYACRETATMRFRLDVRPEVVRNEPTA